MSQDMVTYLRKKMVDKGKTAPETQSKMSIHLSISACLRLFDSFKPVHTVALPPLLYSINNSFKCS